MELIELKQRLRPSFFVPFLILTFLFKTPSLVSASGPKCIPTEREALLTFKGSLTDLSGRLSSWSGPNCCNWTGVLCDSRTSHVIKIDIKNPNQALNSQEFKKGCLRVKIHPSLTRLKFLSYLDLSLNDFNGTEIPEFIGSFVNLRYPNLSSSSFSGEIPASLGNLSKLESLDLYGESFRDSGEFTLRASNLGWLSGLSSSLRYLDMGYVNLSGVGETWLEDFSRVLTLKELHLFNCKLNNLPLSLSENSLKLLEVLDLSENSLSSSIPNWLFGLTSLRKLFLRWDFLQGSIPSGFKNLKLLETLDLSNNLALQGKIPQVLGDLPRLKYLDLSANELNGQINRFLDALSRNKGNSLVFLDLSSNKFAGTFPRSLGSLKNLEILDLSSNSFTGSVPSSIGNMVLLKKLDLSYNTMDGTIAESLGKLEELVDLNLIENSWEGVLGKSHFLNLRSLKNIRLTTQPNKSLVLALPSTWIPPFRLDSVQIENCKIGPSFPMWLQVQTKLNSVTLRNNGIADTIPDSWFLGISSQVTYLTLANNKFKGRLPQNLMFPKLNTIDLSSNNFQGPFPLWSTNATEIRLHENNFSGPLPLNIHLLMPRIQKIYLFHNSFNGVIPSSLCELSSLQILSLRNNQFSGSFPKCWHRSSMLWGIDASENKLSGVIPESLGLLPSLSVLLLNENALEGKIPETLQNCSGLTNIDLGGNKLSGNVPSWLRKLSSLYMLRLQSNSLNGQIPDDLCRLSNLHILDLSGNKISGSIPKCIGNLTAIVHGKRTEEFRNLVFIVTRERKYEAIFDSIDLSSNNINGGIPAGILSLSYLRILDLSRNFIARSIPDKISKLSFLERLDLSRNRFTGTIPQSLASITSLQRLNLSFNELEGSIPKLLKFKDPSIYIGNELLCGKPLPKTCP